jgi:hypothetical protein
MPDTSERPLQLDPDTVAFYRRVLETLRRAGIPVLVGGGYAFAIHTGIERQTKDLDVFLRRADYDRAGEVLGSAGYRTELAFPHWLGKAHCGDLYVDLIFSSGNGVSPVDAVWFEHAIDADVLGVPSKLMPVEEMIWSKAFIMERERYDGADIAHLFHACASTLDWPRLMGRMEPYWRVLLAHVVLFGFIYPGELARIPTWVTDGLMQRLRADTDAPPPAPALCRGTLLSREQYLHDLRQGYIDGRLQPYGSMSIGEIAVWTDAIDDADH